MAKLCPLFSGSQGNSYYIGSAGKGILIDIGKSAKQIENALKENDIDIKDIISVFITHEHTDHIKGLKVFCSRYKIPAYSSKGTISALREKEIIDESFNINEISSECKEFDNMRIKPFNISHDCKEGYGYVIETCDGRKTAIVTDTGCITDEISRAVYGCDTVVIESNYDVRMLESGSYPFLLKRRILSKTGHLSNDDCSEEISKLIHNGSTRFILAHLSLENNIPYLAEQTSICRLKENGMIINRDFLLSSAPAVNTFGSIIY